MGTASRAAELAMGSLTVDAAADLDVIGTELTALQQALTDLR